MTLSKIELGQIGYVHSAVTYIKCTLTNHSGSRHCPKFDVMCALLFTVLFKLKMGLIFDRNYNKELLFCVDLTAPKEKSSSVKTPMITIALCCIDFVSCIC